jgi:hypothetical protein
VNIILAVATILGGLAAIWFFWDKLWPAKADVADDRPQVEVAYVESRYVDDSGLGPRLRGEGYRLFWSDEDKVSRRTQLEGWELATEELTDGRKRTLRRKDSPQDQVLLRKRE